MCQFDGNLRWKSKPKPVHYAFIHGNHYIFKWYFPGLLSFIFGRFFYVCFGECTCHYDHLLGFWWLCRLFLDVDTSFFLFCLNIFSLRWRKKKTEKSVKWPILKPFSSNITSFSKHNQRHANDLSHLAKWRTAQIERSITQSFFFLK